MPEGDKQIHKAEDQAQNQPANPEIPASHDSYNVDPADITAKGLLKACDFFRDAAAKNPELAEKSAQQVVESIQERTKLREEGKSEEEIKKQSWASMAKRSAEKKQTQEKQALPSNPKPEKPADKTAAQATKPKIVSTNDRAEQIAMLEHIRAARTNIMQEPTVSTVTETVSSTATARQQTERPNTLATSPNIAKEEPVTLYDEVPLDIPPVVEAIAPSQPDEQVAVEQPITIAAVDTVDDTPPPIETSPEAAVESAESPIPTSVELPTTEEHAQLAELLPPEATPTLTKLVETILPTEIEAEPETETITPIIQTILELAHTLQEAKELADPELTESTQAELAALVIDLCQQLGIDYTPEDVEQFIAILQQPAFQQLIEHSTDSDQLDLEHLGTHEAKHRFGKVLSTMAKDAERDIRHLIGVLALVQTANA